MKNIKNEFMKNDLHPRIEGKYLVCLNNGYNFIAETVWRMKTRDINHFRFCRETGEVRIEPDKIDMIIEING